ncbi:MAG: TldD/PmbA family protein [Proteobacteria bacterium]|jgi:PmbA protein|nr:TldD/PmbA family protein [Pseudomonadota bacterium]
MKSLEETFDHLRQVATNHQAQVEVSVQQRESLSLSFQLQKLKKYGSDRTQLATVRVLCGGSLGQSTTEDLSESALQQCFEDALAAAKLLDQRDLNNSLSVGLQAPPKIDQLYTGDFKKIEISEKMKLAQELESLALGYNQKISNVPHSGYSEFFSEYTLFSANGEKVTYVSSGASAYTMALAKSGDVSKDGYKSVFRRDPRQINVNKLVTESCELALKMLDAKPLETGKYPILVMNEAAADLVSVLVSHLSAKAVDEKNSLLKDKLGEKIAPNFFEVIDDPFRADLMGCRPFDAEGTGSQRTVLIAGGKPQCFLTNRYYSKKMSIPNTGHAVLSSGEISVSPTNLIVSPQTNTREELLVKYPRVLFLTDIGAIGSGLNQRTGDFSLPASGFLYSRGEAPKAVDQFVISGNLLELFQQLEGLSNKVNDDGNSVQCPDLLFKEISVAGLC